MQNHQLSKKTLIWIGAAVIVLAAAMMFYWIREPNPISFDALYFSNVKVEDQQVIVEGGTTSSVVIIEDLKSQFKDGKLEFTLYGSLAGGSGSGDFSYTIDTGVQAEDVQQVLYQYDGKTFNVLKNGDQ